MTQAHQEIFLKDYQAPAYEILSVDLNVDLYEDHALVKNTMKVKVLIPKVALVLDGGELELIDLQLNSKNISYDVTDKTLNIIGIEKLNLQKADEFTLSIITKTKPQLNTSCEGLYKSGDIFCTQCESQGFRKITYYLDRPDVMSTFTTTITAEKKPYPYLLSNGNQVEKRDLENGRHLVKWHDPHKKPAYLFALVAGDLALVEDSYTTQSGREVSLQIFVDHGNEDRCDHAMLSLKNSMKWDEEKFGLEYDLDIYMIVAVDSFNMGAMENKGLNVFNSVYVLAKKETAIDQDYLGIESVIGHEYFHNWTGNRVTCRDWFQLTLKEGLTVFRDQEFSADMFDPVVQRIMDVTRLREGQFPEDAGPMAHPIQPKSYIEINNFYTSTIYEKGAEVIRMLHTLIGPDQFRAGMDKYFELFDGQAVRTQDFVYAMEQASGRDLTQFKRWYDFAGTPTLDIEVEKNANEVKLKLTQSIPDKGNEKIERQPLHIPFAFAINGEKYLWEIQDWSQTKVISLTETNEEIPVCEWNLNFSAPVKVKDNLGDDNLKAVALKGSQLFSRWNAFQSLVLLSAQGDLAQEELVEILGQIIQEDISEAVKAQFLSLPSEVQLNAGLSELAPKKINEFKQQLFKKTSEKYGDIILEAYHNANEKDFSLSAISIGKRSLRKQCLFYLAYNSDEKLNKVSWDHYQSSRNMTDQFGSLQALVNADHPKTDNAMSHFYEQWKDDNLVINKWLALNALRADENCIERVIRLSQDDVFNYNEPNKLRALYGSFAMRNLSKFHSEKGYSIICNVIEKLDKSNPQVGARIATAFRDAPKLANDLKQTLKTQLLNLKNNLKSSDCYEIVNKTIESL